MGPVSKISDNRGYRMHVKYSVQIRIAYGTWIRNQIAGE